MNTSKHVQYRSRSSTNEDECDGVVLEMCVGGCVNRPALVKEQVLASSSLSVREWRCMTARGMPHSCLARRLAT
jgi:hypothetical protein